MCYALPRAGNGVRVRGSCANFFFFVPKKFRYIYLKRSPFHGFSEPVFFFNLLHCWYLEYLKLRKTTTVKNSLSRIFESCSWSWHKGQFLSQFLRVTSEIFRIKSCTCRVGKNKLECLGLHYSKQEWSCKQYLSKFCDRYLNVSNYFSMKKDLKWNVFYCLAFQSIEVYVYLSLFC